MRLVTVRTTSREARERESERVRIYDDILGTVPHINSLYKRERETYWERFITPYGFPGRRPVKQSEAVVIARLRTEVSRDRVDAVWCDDKVHAVR